MNNLTSDTIFEGQQIMLGLAGPLEVTVTPGPTPTATQLLPTVTPKPGFGNLCIILFEDRNGDSIRQEDEPSIPEGAISVSESAGAVSETATSGVGLEHQCYENLPEGDYTLSVAVPEGYNPTTETSFELELRAGDETYVNFGIPPGSMYLQSRHGTPTPWTR